MNVGIDARLYYESGVGRYIKNTLDELDKYCIVNKDNKFYIFLSKKGFKDLKFESDSMIKVKADIPWHSLKEQVKFVGLLNSHDLDLMHFTYFSLPILYRKKFVVTIHDLIINKVDTGKATTLPRFMYKLKRIAYHKVIKHAVNNSKYIISPSESTKREILSAYSVNKEKIVVIPEGIDPNLLQGKTKPVDKIPGKYILYVGNAYPHKNIEKLIDAYNNISDKIEEDLILVGRDDYFYKKLHVRISKNKRIRILNSINDAELSYLYDNASYLVAPSIIEGFGLTPLEAMGHNLLPVVSAIDAFYEVCKNAALYFNPNDIQDISAILYKASNLNEDEKNKYKKLYENRVKIFSWKKSFEKTMKIYERCYSL